MKLLRGYIAKTSSLVEYPYNGETIYMWEDARYLDLSASFFNCINSEEIPVGENIWNETTKRV